MLVSKLSSRMWSQSKDHDLPVSRVKGNGVDLDEDIIVPHLRKRNFLYLGLANADVFDGLHGLG